MDLNELKIDDTFFIKELTVPKATINNVEFDALNIKGPKVKVIDDYKGNKLCLFDRCLFFSKIDNTFKAWNDSALCIYLKTVFSDSLSKIFNCNVEANLLTVYQLFGTDEMDSKFSIPLRRYRLEKDSIAYFYDDNKPLAYWTSTMSSGKNTAYQYVEYLGETSNIAHPNSIYVSVRPAFLIKTNDITFDNECQEKLDKKNSVLMASILAIYQKNDIPYTEISLYPDYFSVQLYGKKFWFGYDTFQNEENLRKLKELPDIIV